MAKGTITIQVKPHTLDLDIDDEQIYDEQALRDHIMKNIIDLDLETVMIDNMEIVSVTDFEPDEEPESEDDDEDMDDEEDEDEE